MSQKDDSENVGNEEVEKLIDDEVNDEYDVAFNKSTERAAEFGSLMVSLRMVANQLNTWTQKGRLPEVDDLEDKKQMISEALDEAPTEELQPGEEFDNQMIAIVNYAEELQAHLSNLKSARTIVDEANNRISKYEREFEILRE